MLHSNTITIRYNDDTFSTSFTRSDENGPFQTEDVLEHIFAEWNAGSGRECGNFISKGIRSLSVGDYVCVDGLWFRCEGFGWSVQTNEDVNKWFDTLTSVRSQRPTSLTINEEIAARWRDRRKTEELLGIFS